MTSTSVVDFISNSTPPASRLEGKVETDACFVQLRSQASSNRRVRTFVQLLNESIDVLELFNFFREIAGVLKKRISYTQIFWTSEVLIQVQRFTFSGQVVRTLLRKPLLDLLFNRIRHSLPLDLENKAPSAKSFKRGRQPRKNQAPGTGGGSSTFTMYETFNEVGLVESHLRERGRFPNFGIWA